MSRRDDAIVAWHEVPGRVPPQKVRPVGVRCDSCRYTNESIENLFGLTWAASPSRMERSLNALAAFQTISISVSRSFRKRSIPLSSSSNNIGHGPMDLSRRVLSLLKKQGAISTRNTLGLAAPDHTVPYGTDLFEDAFPGTSCQATIGLSLRDGLADASQRHLA